MDYLIIRMQSILDLIRNPSHSRTLGILAVLAIVLAIPLTVKIAQQQQELRQRAESCQKDLGTFCGDPGINGVTCSPVQDTTAQCPAGAEKVRCHLTSCEGALTQKTPTPASTTNPTTATSNPVNNLSCPGTDIPSAPHSGNTEEWGGACPQDGTIARNIPGKPCSCTVADCKKYSGGPYCWVNNGQVHDDPAGCKAKGANIPDSCFTSTPTPTPTASPNPSSCTVSGQSVCNPKSNTCGGEGTQILVYQTPDGKPCPALTKTVNCTVDPAVDNCSGGNTCSPAVGAGGKCVSGTQNTTTNPTTSVSTTFNITNLVLDGIGNAAGVVGIHSPNKSRSGKLELLNPSTRALVDSKPITLSYNSDGTFKTQATFTNLPSGNYLPKLKINGYLWKNYPEVTSTQGTDYTNDSRVALVAGDLNGDNKLDISDYNILSGCFGKAGSGDCALADMDDTGTVDAFDYNLWLREFNLKQQGD